MKKVQSDRDRRLQGECTEYVTRQHQMVVVRMTLEIKKIA